MTKLLEIEERWKAFKHWNEKLSTMLYDDSAGPDVEYLINRVKKLEAAAKKISGCCVVCTICASCEMKKALENE